MALDRIENLLEKYFEAETSIAEEIKVIASLPTIPFLKAGIKHVI